MINLSPEDELLARRWFMDKEGYRFCDIPACNCNSWHGGNASNRLREIRETLDELGVSTNGVILIDAIKGEIERLRAAVVAERERCAKIADDYDEWTFWGQYNNLAAAVTASKEIAAAIRLGRPLTADEIRDIDRGAQ